MERKNNTSNIASLIFCVIACLSPFILLLFVIATRGRFAELYGEFGLSMPFLSKVFISTSGWVFLIIFIIFTIFLIIKERLKNKTITLIINLLVTFVIGISFSLHIIALFLPVFRLTEAIEYPQKDIRKIIPHLHSQDPEERAQAVYELGKTGNKEALEPLIVALQDEDVIVRQKAVRALWDIKDRRAIESLISVLKDEDKGVRSDAARALGEIKDPRAVEYLIVVLRDDKDRTVQYHAMDGLRRITGENFLFDYEKWQEWWGENKEKFDSNKKAGE